MPRSRLASWVFRIALTYALLLGGVASALAATTLTQTDATYTTASPSNLTGGFNTLYTATSSAVVSGSGASADVRLSSTNPWAFTTVDSQCSVGQSTSIAIDTNGNAHISYFDNCNADLRYATNASGSWATTTVDSQGDVGRYTTSIAIDANGKAHIAYQDSGNGDLRYATNALGSWATSTIDSQASNGYNPSIALDTNGKAHISYWYQSGADLRYATNISGSWATTTLDSIGNVGYNSSIALDTNGKAYVAYLDSTNSALKYATNLSGSWATSTAQAGAVTYYLALDIDSNGKAHISNTLIDGTYVCGFDEVYQEDTYCDDYALYYTTNASGSWVSTSIDSDGVVGEYSSIALDAADKAHLSYWDHSNARLKYATNGSGQWAIVTPTLAGAYGEYSSIDVDSSNGVHISSLDGNNGDLNYASNAAPLYTTPGTYKSYVDGEVASPSWSTFTATKSSTASGAGSTAFKIKTSSSSTTPPTFDASGAACDFTVSSDGSSGSKDLTTCTGLGTARYLWYQATLTTADTSKSPLLQDVTVTIADAASAPTVTTQAASSLTQTTATANGNITATGSTDVTVRGFAYGTSATLATAIATTTDSAGQPFSTGAYTGSITSLTCNTAYYVRAYATNSVGDGLGSIETFTTSACSVADTTDPTITLTGSASMVVLQDDTYTDAGATATDDTDGDVTSDIVVTGSVNTAVPGPYTLTYNVSDAAGNAATAVTRTVTVKKRNVTSSSSSSSGAGAGPSAPRPSPLPPSPRPSATFTRNTFLGMRGDDVRALQQFLNTHGFPITATGPGSPGSETDFFGALTKAALIKFQKANNITPAVGFFGPVTRGVVGGGF